MTEGISHYIFFYVFLCKIQREKIKLTILSQKLWKIWHMRNRMTSIHVTCSWDWKKDRTCQLSYNFIIIFHSTWRDAESHQSSWIMRENCFKARCAIVVKRVAAIISFDLICTIVMPIKNLRDLKNIFCLKNYLDMLRNSVKCLVDDREHYVFLQLQFVALQT